MLIEDCDHQAYLCVALTSTSTEDAGRRRMLRDLTIAGTWSEESETGQTRQSVGRAASNRCKQPDRKNCDHQFHEHARVAHDA